MSLREVTFSPVGAVFDHSRIRHSTDSFECYLAEARHILDERRHPCDPDEALPAAAEALRWFPIPTEV
jgi:hypothetical protein